MRMTETFKEVLLTHTKSPVTAQEIKVCLRKSNSNSRVIYNRKLQRYEVFVIYTCVKSSVEPEKMSFNEWQKYLKEQRDLLRV